MGITAAVTSALTSLGVGAETAGVIAPALVGTVAGAGGGAVLGAATGGDPGTGALTGALTGGGIGAGGALGAGTALGSAGGAALGGAAGGALGHAVTGGNPLTGALEGGVSGGITGLSPGSTGSAGGAAGGAAPAVGSATGAESALPPGDVSAPVNLTGAVPASDFASQIGTGAVPAALQVGDINPATGFPVTSPEAGFGGSGAAGIPATTGPSFLQSIGIGAPQQGLNPPIANTGVFGSTVPPNPAQINEGLNGALRGGNTGATESAGGGATGAGDKSTSLGRFIKNPSLSTAGDVLASNPTLALGAGGLLYEATRPQPQIPNLGALQSQAAALAQEGAALRAPLTGAPLPTGAQSAIDLGTESAKAAIRSHFAEAGLSGSSMEAAALAEADREAIAQRFQVAQGMAQQGAQLTGLDLGTYQNIIQQTLGRDQQLQNAISNFAASMAGAGLRG